LHVELRDGALRFREHLAEAQASMEAELKRAPPDDLPPSVWDVKLYATAVTLLAAAAVEAALNQYGLMRFGPEQFEQHFAYDGPVKRLRRLIKYGRGLELSDDHPLVAALTRLSERRNALVHPRAHMSIRDAQGVFRTPEAAWQSPIKLVHADQSLDEMNQFLVAFPDLDPETATFLRPWSLRYR
jgi:hypothetical protein